jgi:hypothetical protein
MGKLVDAMMNKMERELAVEWSEEQQTAHIVDIKSRRKLLLDTAIYNGYKLVCVCRSLPEAIWIAHALQDSAKFRKLRKLVNE